MESAAFSSEMATRSPAQDEYLRVSETLLGGRDESGSEPALLEAAPLARAAAREESPSLTSFGWFRPRDSRSAAEKRLQAHGSRTPGAFVLRASSKDDGYVVTTLQPCAGDDSSSGLTARNLRVYTDTSGSRFTLDSPKHKQQWHPSLLAMIRDAQDGGASCLAVPLANVFDNPRPVRSVAATPQSEFSV